MQYALLVIQFATAATFLLAAVGKILRPEELAAALRLSHMPAPLARAAAAVPGIEIGMCLLLVLLRGTALAIAFAAAAALLAGFTGWMVWILLRGMRVRCGCFGSSDREVGWRAVGRNGLLIALAGAGAALSGVSETALPSFSVWALATTSAIALTGAVLLALVRALPAMVLTMTKLSQSTGQQGAR